MRDRTPWRSSSLLNTVLLFGLVFAAPMMASEHEEIVDRAIRAMENDFRESWAFREVATREESVFVAEYDPRRPEDARWELLSVDDRAPSAKEIEAFLDRKEKNRKDDRDEDEDRGIEAHVRPESLRLLEETDEHWLFSFVPAEEDEDADFFRHIEGTLKVLKQPHSIEYFDMRSDKPFKPATGIKVKSFHSRLTFGPAGPDGPIVPQSVDVKVEGRAFLAVKFNEAEKIRYSDYRYVGEELLAPVD